MLLTSSLMHSRAATRMENGTRDYRCFAPVLLIVRVLLYIIFALSPTVLFYGGAQFVFITLAVMTAIMKPYKPQFVMYNGVNSVLVLLLALWCATFVCINIAAMKAWRWLILSVVLSFILAVLPLFYISFLYTESLDVLSMEIRPENGKKSPWLE